MSILSKMALKQVSRSATVAFAPMTQVFAAGTMAGAIDLSFSSSACVELFGIDIASENQDLSLLGSATASDRFNRLTWGRFGSENAAFPYGILAGGLVDGSVNLWNPAKLMSGSSEDVSSALVKKLQAHSGAVRGLEFNTYNLNMLASGGEDGEIKIWNIDNPVEPSQYAPLRSGGVGEISYLSWNPKVAHILASTSFSGNSVVWDLRKQKQVISFTDPSSRRRCSALQWNPDLATQLIVASDEDKSPSLQVWDLRNSISPVKELVSHTKGVLAMAWCPHDSGLVLSCAKDNRTLCWDTVSGEVLYELPAGSNWNFDLQWSPCTRGLLSTSSFDGQISLYNIESAGRIATPGDDFAVLTNQAAPGLSRAPQWLKRPSSVSFGFGGKLASVGVKKTGGSEVKVHRLKTEEEFVERSSAFEAAVAGGDKPTMKSFCETKAAAAGNDGEKETWNFLTVLFEDDARTKLLTHLDFQVPVTASEFQEEDQADQIAGEVEEKLALGSSYDGVQQPLVVPPSVDVPGSTGAMVGDEDFFDNIQESLTPRATVPVSVPPTVPPVTVAEDEEDGEDELEDEVEVEEVEEDPEVEDAIQRALVVGNYEGAVDACLAAGRMADALVIASVGGTDLWSKTQRAYMKAITRPYMKVIECVVNNDLRELINSRPSEQWKETLALLCTYGASTEWASLCDALASKLEGAGDLQSATLCYICAGNIERTVDIWLQNFPASNKTHASVLALQDVMEKAVVLSMASGGRKMSASMAKLVSEYVDLLASQGLLSTAFEYLNLVPADESSEELNVLRDRVYRSGEVSVGAAPAPSFPFEAQDLVVGQQHPISTPPAPVMSPYQTPAPAPVVSPYQTPAVQTPQPPSRLTYALPAQPMQPTYHPPAVQAAPSAPQPQTFRPRQASQSMFVPKASPPVPNVEKYQQQVPSALYGQPAGALPIQPYQPIAPSQVPSQPQPLAPPPQSAPPSYSTAPPPTNLMVPTAPIPPRNSTSMARPPSFVPMPGPASPNISSGAPVVPATPTPVPTRVTAPEPPPVAAPPTVQTADVSNVAAELKPVVAILTRLFHETLEQAGGARAPPLKKREIDDNSKKLGGLFYKLNVGDVSPQVSGKLQHLCQAVAAGDYDTAMKMQVGLTTTEWDECGAWLVALKRMIKSRHSSG